MPFHKRPESRRVSPVQPRVFHIPVEEDDLAWALRKGAPGLRRQHHNDVVVVKIRNPDDRLGDHARNLEALLLHEGHGHLIDGLRLQPGAGESEVRQIERTGDSLGDLAAAGVVFIHEEHAEEFRAGVLGVFAGTHVEHLHADVAGLVGDALPAAVNHHQRVEGLERNLLLAEQRDQVLVQLALEHVHGLPGGNGLAG